MSLSLLILGAIFRGQGKLDSRTQLSDPQALAAYRYVLKHTPKPRRIAVSEDVSKTLFQRMHRYDPRVVSRKFGDLHPNEYFFESGGQTLTTERGPLVQMQLGQEPRNDDTKILPADSFWLFLRKKNGGWRATPADTHELPTELLAMAYVAVGPDTHVPAFLNAPAAVVRAARKCRFSIESMSSFKRDDDYIGTGFSRIDHSDTVWIDHDQALAWFGTYFRPKGGDTTYALGGPVRLSRRNGHWSVKVLQDQWAGE